MLAEPPLASQQPHAQTGDREVEHQDEMQRDVRLEHQEQQVRRIQQPRHPVGEEGDTGTVERIPQ
jgi:hypothetical protein